MTRDCYKTREIKILVKIFCWSQSGCFAITICQLSSRPATTQRCWFVILKYNQDKGELVAFSTWWIHCYSFPFVAWSSRQIFKPVQTNIQTNIQYIFLTCRVSWRSFALKIQAFLNNLTLFVRDRRNFWMLYFVVFLKKIVFLKPRRCVFWKQVMKALNCLEPS